MHNKCAAPVFSCSPQESWLLLIVVCTIERNTKCISLIFNNYILVLMLVNNMLAYYQANLLMPQLLI